MESAKGERRRRQSCGRDPIGCRRSVPSADGDDQAQPYVQLFLAENGAVASHPLSAVEVITQPLKSTINDRLG